MNSRKVSDGFPINIDNSLYGQGVKNTISRKMVRKLQRYKRCHILLQKQYVTESGTTKNTCFSVE